MVQTAQIAVKKNVYMNAGLLAVKVALLVAQTIVLEDVKMDVKALVLQLAHKIAVIIVVLHVLMTVQVTVQDLQANYRNKKIARTNQIVRAFIFLLIFVFKFNEWL